jgi:hypothetical protein
MIGGALGAETGPGEGIIIPASRLAGSLVGSALEDALQMSQNNKGTRSKICSLQSQVDEHQKKLDQDPEGPNANHWRIEIKAFMDRIERLQRRLPNGK